MSLVCYILVRYWLYRTFFSWAFTLSVNLWWQSYMLDFLYSVMEFPSVRRLYCKAKICLQVCRCRCVNFYSLLWYVHLLLIFELLGAIFLCAYCLPCTKQAALWLVPFQLLWKGPSFVIRVPTVCKELGSYNFCLLLILFSKLQAFWKQRFKTA